jgi:hypothetical protein
MYISVNPSLVRQMQPGLILPALTLMADRAAESYETACSVRILGPSRLIYDRAHRLANGASIFIATGAGVEVETLTADQGLAALAEIEAATRAIYLHTNVHRIRQDSRDGTSSPVVAIRRTRSGPPTYCVAVDVAGEALLVSAPCKKLKCGAKVYLVSNRRG